MKNEHAHQTSYKVEYQILHRCLTRLIYSFHKFEDVVCIAVNDGDADIIVIFVLDPRHHEHFEPNGVWNSYRVRILFNLRGPGGKNVRGINLRVHGICLTGINHE